MLAVLLAVLVAQAVAERPAAVADVRQLKPSAPAVLAEIDTSAIPGEPVGLAVRADGTIYLRVAESKDKARHYRVSTQPVVSFGQSDGAPQWAADDWMAKTSLVAPGDPSLRIDVQQRREASRTVNSPGGADIAGISSVGTQMVGGGGGEGVSQGVAIAAANSTVVNGIITLRFKGHVVGEWTNEVPQLGMRFGWAPAGTGMLAYVDAEGRLFVADREGRQLQVGGVAKAVLPAWSPDGSRILCLQKKSRTVYLLTAATVK